MTVQHMSVLARDRLTKPWEEFVGYPYDDKVPKRRGANGKLVYPEWRGGPLRGTLTIGFGHTDAAGPVLDLGAKIVPGMRLTQEQGDQLLANDLAPCELAVARLVKVGLGQHQADTLEDFVFNAGAGTLQKSTLLRKLNAGDYDAVPAELMKFTMSRGEHMEGLVHRRSAEISMWNMPDEATDQAKAAIPISPEDHGIEAEDVQCPKADMPAGATTNMAQSTIGNSSIAAGLGTAATTGAAVLKSVGDAVPAAPEPSSIADLIDHANSAADVAGKISQFAPPPSVLKIALTFATDPVVIGALGAVTLGFLAYIWFRRRWHLEQGGV